MKEEEDRKRRKGRAKISELNISCKKIVGGLAKGKMLFSEKPINFLGMVNHKTGEIIDSNHPLYNQCLKDTILIFPNSTGSSVGAYTIFSLKTNQVSPNGIICTSLADITTASGCAISNIPLALLNNNEFRQLKEHIKKFSCDDHFELILDAENELLIVDDNDRSII